MISGSSPFEKLNAALQELSSYGLHPVDTEETVFSLASDFTEVGLRIVPDRGVFCLYTAVPGGLFEDSPFEQALVINSTSNLLSGNNRLFCDNFSSDTVRLGVCISFESSGSYELERRIVEFLRTFPEDLKRVSDYFQGLTESSAPAPRDSLISVPDYFPGQLQESSRPESSSSGLHEEFGKAFSVGEMSFFTPGMLPV